MVLLFPRLLRHRKPLRALHRLQSVDSVPALKVNGDQSVYTESTKMEEVLRWKWPVKEGTLLLRVVIAHVLTYTRGVTKGFLVGEHQHSHYAKYEYHPDDSIHLLPVGRHTWSTVS